MSPQITSILLVGMKAEAGALARAAGRQLFPDAAVTEVASLEEARKRLEPPGTELLLMGESASVASAEAAATVDARGWPRWPVIVFGPQPPAAMVLPPEEWNPRAAARILQAAVAAHAQARDNARLRGDLFTIGRRLGHDLRTPLMGITTACDALAETFPGEDESRAVFTQAVTRSSGEISRLVDRIAGVLRATAEPRSKAPVAMGEVVWAALQRLERRTREKGATVQQPSSWPVVPGVAPWLELIWGDLVGNALEHGGATPAIELGWKADPAGWRFWAEDRGPGVATRAVAGLFQPFDLLHRPSAPRGWGLSMVQRLVELQEGACGYEARAGGGSRFFFSLPV
jgi:signal transduction histidine kinase